MSDPRDADRPADQPGPDQGASPVAAPRPAPAYGEYAPEGSAPPQPAPGVPQGGQGRQVGQDGQGGQGGPYRGQPYGGAPQGGPQGGGPAVAPGAGAWAGGSWPQTLATYEKYEQAQAAVDLLSDQGFPVEAVSIVGHDIRTVENVTGRLTKGKAALRAMGGGAWFGLLLGVLFGLFSPGGAWLGILLLAVGLGALWGALFGFVGHAATKGQRDFASVRTMEAGRYEVLVRGELTAQAHQVLASGRSAG